MMFALTGATCATVLFNLLAMSPDLCGPGPRSAIARKYSFSPFVRRSNRTLKKLASNALVADLFALLTSDKEMFGPGASFQV